MLGRTRGAIATGLVLVALTFMTLQGLLLYRPLPAIDGYFRFLGLDQHAEVVRDSFGVPRIEAGTLHDLFFLQGYVTAQDRFAQMEAMRSSEAVRSVALKLAAPLADDQLDAVNAYVLGVTKYIDQHAAARALPAEIALSGRRPPSWTAMDTLAIAAVHLEARSRTRCTAAAGERSHRGVPLLMADLDSAAPAPGWYEIGLVGPSLRAIGLSLPGVPGIVAGHNGLVAWSLHGAPLARVLSVPSASAIVGLSGAGPTVGCLADVQGGITGPSQQGNDLDVEALRIALGPAEPKDGGARIVIDLGDLDASRAALSTGQSGHPVAFHYRDQAQLWSAGMLHRLAWTPEAIARMEGRLVLRPR